MLKGSDKETVRELLQRAAQARRIGDTLSEEARRGLREYADQLENQARAQEADESVAQDAPQGAPMPSGDRVKDEPRAENTRPGTDTGR